MLIDDNLLQRTKIDVLMRQKHDINTYKIILDLPLMEHTCVLL